MEVNVEDFLSNTVHEILEKLYYDIQYLKENFFEGLITFFHVEWEKNWNYNFYIVFKSADLTE
jgi:hypothetical protein